MVIGGGIVGLWVSYRLIKAGCSVVLIDRRRIAKESSWAAAGILGPLHPHIASQNHQWMDRAGQAYTELASNIGTFTVDDGGLYCFDEQKDPIHYPDVLLVNPVHAARALHQWLLAQTRFQQKITEQSSEMQALFTSSHTRLAGVKIASETIACDHCVVSAGAWTSKVLQQLVATGTSIDVTPQKGQMLAWQLPKSSLDLLPYRAGVTLSWPNIYLAIRSSGMVLAGSTVEESGYDSSTSIDGYTSIFGRLQSIQCLDTGLGQDKGFDEGFDWFDVLTKHSVRSWHWAGLRPYSAGGPHIGLATDSCANLWACSGHFREGIAMAPKSAQILVEAILSSD